MKIIRVIDLTDAQKEYLIANNKELRYQLFDMEYDFLMQDIAIILGNLKCSYTLSFNYDDIDNVIPYPANHIKLDRNSKRFYNVKSGMQSIDFDNLGNFLKDNEIKGIAFNDSELDTIYNDLIDCYGLLEVFTESLEVSGRHSANNNELIQILLDRLDYLIVLFEEQLSDVFEQWVFEIAYNPEHLILNFDSLYGDDDNYYVLENNDCHIYEQCTINKRII